MKKSAGSESPRVRFRPTLSGLAGLCFLFVLFWGLPRGNPAALLLGLGIPALVVFSLLPLLAVFLPLIRYARNSQGEGGLLPSRLEPGKRVSLGVDPRRPSFFPGVRLEAVWRLDFAGDSLETAARLPRRGPAAADLVIPRRGVWRGRAFFRAADPFGFFVLEIPRQGYREVLCPPLLDRRDGNGLFFRPEAVFQAARHLKEQAAEKLEHRPYLPGDDPRHLDWKHYARTGGLIIRLGEESRSYRGRIWVLLLADGLGKGRPGRARMDRLAENLGSLVWGLVKEGLEVVSRLPGEEEWHPVQDETSWGNRLAPLLPEGPGGEIPAPPGKGEPLLLAAHPDSPSALGQAEAFLRGGQPVSLVYFSPVSFSSPRPPWWQHSPRSSPSFPGRFALIKEKKSLETAAAAAKAGGVDVHVL